MTDELAHAFLIGFVVFCRTGACVMMLPGLSNEQIPMRARLYIAIGLSVPLSISLADSIRAGVVGASIPSLTMIIVVELLIGALLGILARLFVLALETLASAVVLAIGIGNVLGAPVNEGEPLPAMAAFVVFGATTLIFVTDQHWELIRGLRDSYVFAPVRAAFNAEAMISEILTTLRKSYQLVFRICSPFLLFSLMVNLSFGFLNRLSPHISVYFLSAPLLMLAGVYWFYTLSADFFSVYSAELGQWISKR